MASNGGISPYKKTTRSNSSKSSSLLNETEQQDVFEDYGAFLMSTLGEGIDDTLQFLEPTIPVNMTAYLNGLKRRYLALQKDHPEQQFKIQLPAGADHRRGDCARPAQRGALGLCRARRRPAVIRSGADAGLDDPGAERQLRI